MKHGVRVTKKEVGKIDRIAPIQWVKSSFFDRCAFAGIEKARMRLGFKRKFL